MRSKLSSIYSLEQLSGRDTFLHKLHPGVKLFVTAVFILCVASFGRYSLARLMPYFVYLVLIMAFGEIPWAMIARRCLVALPFVLFAGISNVIFDRAVVMVIGRISITGGVLSLITLLFRTVLCVGAVLILVALTPISHLTEQLRRMRMPEMLVMLFEMVYRYIGVLGEEAVSMVTSYRLRGNGAKWPKISQFSSFVGQLLLRSNDRAQRIYYAMTCRLYGLGSSRIRPRKMSSSDWLFVVLVSGGCILLRFVDVSTAIGEMFV